MRLWRISNYPVLSGEGGLRYAGRWHQAGHRIVYLADSPASALLEVLVHLEIDLADLPATFTLLTVNAPDDLHVEPLETVDETGWKLDLAQTRELGTHWLKAGTAALARVPSAILPETNNYLLNPMHAEAGMVTIATVQTVDFDRRLFR